MKNFEYAVPDSLDKVYEYLKAPNTKLKAGGIDLLDLMKEEITAPARLVDIRDLKELMILGEDNNGSMCIGAGHTLSELATSKSLQGPFLALAQAVGNAAIPQVRNVATLGGNLCQRPRCWYFRSSDFHCSRKGGATCFALDGENQYHAIFENSDGCAMVQPSSSAVALLALNARLKINNGDNETEVPIEKFYVPPGTDIERETILKTDQVILAAVIPAEMKSYVSFYMKQKEKQAYDWPLADVAVALKIEGTICKDARIAMGSVAPIPLRALAAEKYLVNKKLDKGSAESAAAVAVQSATPLGENTFKIRIIQTMIYRTLCQAAGIDPMN
ncbi:MAG: xanthine dehydrogenase family protein subunit M [Calditrichales bacterium]|nr:MAG: xanthine dehydrogenase family protein subunit M [Calditrichales bacterium]